MKSIILIILFLASSSLYGKNLFESFNAAKLNSYTSSLSNDKLMLLYFHDDNCPGCHRMNRETFQDSSVIEKINKDFICLDIDTKTEVGMILKAKYKTLANPSFVFIDRNDEEVHRFVGYRTTEEFLALVSDALDKSSSLGLMKKKYDRGYRNPEFLRSFCYKLEEAMELDTSVICEYYRNISEEDLLSEANLKFFYDFAYFNKTATIKYKSKEFDFITSHQSAFCKYFDEEQVKTRIVFLYASYIQETIKNDDLEGFERMIQYFKPYDKSGLWELKNDFKVTHNPTIVANNYCDEQRVHFFRKNRHRGKYYEELDKYIKSISKDPELLNWNAHFYTNRGDSEEEDYKFAEEWILKSLAIERKFYNVATYVEVLMKLGKFDEALKVSDEAIALGKEGNFDINYDLILRDEILSELKKKSVKQD